VKLWTGFIWIRTGIGDNSCEHGNVPSGTIKGGELLNHVTDYQLHKKDSAPRNKLIKKTVDVSIILQTVYENTKRWKTVLRR